MLIVGSGVHTIYGRSNGNGEARLRLSADHDIRSMDFHQAAVTCVALDLLPQGTGSLFNEKSFNASFMVCQ